MPVVLNLLSYYSPMDDSSDSPSENQFFEHLTELIRVFKAVFLAFDDTITLMRDDEDYDQEILRIRKIMNDEAELVQQFNLSLEPHPHLHSAYQRFVCRLQQHIAASKAKGAKEDRHIPLAEEYVLKVESCINFHRKERNVARLFGRIFAYTLKFCDGCEMLLSCCSQNEAIDLLRKQADEERQKADDVKVQSRPLGPPQSQSQSAFHKIMTVYNKRFATISCLDLDYNTYKTYCFMSRNQTDQQLYKDYINRNAIVSKALMRYSKQFTDYLRRREKNLMRKNRFRELKQVKVSENSQLQHQTLQSRQNPQQKKSHTLFEPKTEESPIISLPTLQQEKKRILEPQQFRRQESTKATRGNYQLKSIYLTIGKQNEKSQAMHTANRFMFNYSLPKPQDSSKKYSALRVNDTSLKRTQIVNNQPISSSFMMHYDRNEGYQSLMLEQMLYQSKMANSPRTSIIHKCHKEKKGEKRNIRVTNLTFRGSNYTRLAPVFEQQNSTIS